MVIAEVLTGISLVKSSVDFIKSNLNTANDIGSIAKQIDDLFKGEKQIQRSRNKKSSHSISRQLGVESVAQEVIDAKLAQEQIQEISTLVDMRFGHGTWAGIIAERQRRIQKVKEEEKKHRIQRMKNKEAFTETAMMIAIILGSVMIVGVIVVVAVLNVR